MEGIEDCSDDRHKSWCIHCATPLTGTDVNEDHVPTKSLLAKPRPHHLPVVTVCSACNNGFSRDEQYVAVFLSCVVEGSTDPRAQSNESASRALAASPALRAKIDASRSEQDSGTGETETIWTPERQRFERVIVKNARGHAYFEIGEPMFDPPERVWMNPLQLLTPDQRNAFETYHVGALSAWPEVGSRMMTRLVSGEDLSDGWVIVQEGTYRYAVDQNDGGTRVRTVLLDYLATEVRWLD